MNSVKKWLLTNAAFSTVCATLSITLNSKIQSWFGFQDPQLVPELGIGLYLFAGFLMYTAYQQPVNKKTVNIISMMDALWVVGSLFLVLFQAFSLTETAYVAISIVAVCVGLFGFMQFKTNK